MKFLKTLFNRNRASVIDIDSVANGDMPVTARPKQVKPAYSFGNSDAQRKLFASTDYLNNIDKPEMIIAVPVRDVLHSPLTKDLKEENAEILKNLVTDYNFKIIACTFYPAPDNEKLQTHQHAVFTACGISECYHADLTSSIIDKSIVKQAVLEFEKVDFSQVFKEQQQREKAVQDNKLGVYDLLAAKHGILKENFAVIGTRVLENITIEDAGYKVFYSLEDLAEFVKARSSASKNLTL